MIEILKGFPDNVAALACRGHVTRQDYETVLVPHVEALLKRHDKVRLYYEIGADFTAIDPGAVWEDFKVGMAHLTHWERVAVVTDVDWIRHTMSLFAFVIPGDVRIFPMAEAAQARGWLTTG